ncbi:hypothetical protein LINPERHAP1_LOCUS9479 [Linum perenne]
MDINEMVAIFLITIGHNIKNRKAQFLFQRSAETITCVFKLVLLSILKMELQLLAKPTPVPPGCTNKNWKYFPQLEEKARAYKAWSDKEERFFFDIQLSLQESGALKSGTLQKPYGFTDKEKQLKVVALDTKHTAESCKTKFRYLKLKFHAQLDLMNASGMGWNPDKGCYECDPDVFAGWVKSHKQAAGMNNTRFPYWDELCKIFEVTWADGSESMTAKDAASRLEGQIRRERSFDAYTAETTPMMEDLINEGYDMNAEGLKDVEEDTASKDVEDDTATKGVSDKGKGMSSGSKRSRQQATENYLTSINEQMASFQESIARTTSNIERLTNNWCMPEDVASRRKFLVDEINRLPGISYQQGLKAIRILMKDPADWETFCMLPTDKMKEDFILSVLME